MHLARRRYFANPYPCEIVFIKVSLLWELEARRGDRGQGKELLPDNTLHACYSCHSHSQPTGWSHPPHVRVLLTQSDHGKLGVEGAWAGIPEPVAWVSIPALPLAGSMASHWWLNFSVQCLHICRTQMTVVRSFTQVCCANQMVYTLL